MTRAIRGALAIALALVLATAGCLKALAPDVGAEYPDAPAASDASNGDGAVVNCSNVDSNPAVSVSFANDIHGGIMTVHGCIACHTGDGLGISQSGLNLSSYTTLRAGGGHGANVVIPGMPCASYLWQKVSPAPPFGRRMPYNGPPYLSDAEQQLIHDWIAEGALDN